MEGTIGSVSCNKSIDLHVSRRVCRYQRGNNQNP